MYQQYAQPFNIQQQLPYVNMVFETAVSQSLQIASLQPELTNAIYPILTKDGYALMLGFLTYEFSKAPWDELKAQNIVTAVVKYVIMVEANAYNIQIPEFMDCFTYVNQNINAVQGAQQPQPQQMQQPFQQQRPAQFQPQWPPANPQGFVGRGNAGFQPNVQNQYPQQQQPFNPVTSFQPSQQVPQYQPDPNPQIKQSALAGATMNKNSHVPSPNPNALRFESRDAAFIPAAKPVDATADVVSKIPVTDNRVHLSDLDVQLLLEVSDSNETRMAEIISLTAENTTPVITNQYMTTYIPIPSATDIDFISKLAALKTTKSIVEVGEILLSIREATDCVKLFGYISGLISNTVLTALEYRYDITDQPGFPFLTQYEACCALLDEYGIRADIETIVLTKINTVFNNIAITTSIVEKAGKSKTISMLALAIDTDILVLPWMCKHSYNDRVLKIHNHKTGDALNDVYQQLFNHVHETTLFVDIYDSSLLHYRVYRCGRKTMSPNRFLVDVIR